MRYNFDKLVQHCVELGFKVHRSSVESLAVEVANDAVLVFKNPMAEADALIGFDGTPWHAHGKVVLMVDQARYVELSEYELLSALRAGDVVIVERVLSGKVADRWVAHKQEAFSIKFIEPGEELRIRCVGQ